MAVKNGVVLILVLVVPLATGALAYPGTVNGSEISAQASHAAIVIISNSDFAGQAASEGWPGDGSESSPYVIQGLIIESAESCISIQYVSFYFEIRNCELITVSSYQDCIYFFEVSNALVESCSLTSTEGGLQLGRVYHSVFRNNVARQCGKAALSLWETTQCTFINNTFCDGGLVMWPMAASEVMNEFVNNTVLGGELGYFLNVTGKTIDASSMTQVVLANCRNVIVRNGQFSDTGFGPSVLFSTNCTIEQSEVCGTDFGIHVMFSDATRLLDNKIIYTRYMAILVNTSDNCVIMDNEIFSDGYSGIELSDSPNVFISGNQIRNCSTGVNIYLTCGGTVTDNYFTENREYGVLLFSDATNYTLFNNTFVMNNGLNARDDGAGNVWDDGVSLGNRWDDYSGYGVYNITGMAESVDRYPMAVNATAPEFAPWISHPYDIAYPFGQTGNTITWYVVANEPASYSVSRDDQIVLSRAWDSLPVTVNIDYLSSGYYNFTMVVLDKEGDSAFDTVMVRVYTVTDGTLPINSTTSTTTGGLERYVGQIVTIGSVCVIVAFVVLIIRIKPEDASMGWST